MYTGTPIRTLRMAIDDSVGRWKKARKRMHTPVARYTTGAHGYPEDIRLVLPDDFSRNTPVTAKRGKMPSANPITVKIWSNVPKRTITEEMAPCKAIDLVGTLNLGCTCASPLKNN